MYFCFRRILGHRNRNLILHALMHFAADGQSRVFVYAQGRFDAHIEVLGKTKQLKIQYNTPYIRHLPTLLTVKETHNNSLQEKLIRPTFKYPYTVELEYFYDLVTRGGIPKTSPEDYWDDLRLFKMIIDALK